VLVLQHPREHDKAIGTARIAQLSLPCAEVAVGVDFHDHPRVRALLADASYPPVLLYPGPQAKDLTREPPQGPVTLVVIDGTWHQARSLVRKNPWLQALPHYSLTPDAPSEYRIRREPALHCVSTIEALAHALGALEGEPERFQSALMAPFRAMVERQLEYAAQSPGGRVRRKRRRNVVAASRLPALLAEPELVCVGGESNAWPYAQPTHERRYPDELVQWLAFRLSNTQTFSSLIVPTHPLAMSPVRHGRLEAGSILAAPSFEEVSRAFLPFCSPSDVLITWGEHALGLYVAQGGALPERRVDLRKVVGDYFRCRPSGLEDAMARLELGAKPCGPGRAGERLGMLIAITRRLSDEARGLTPKHSEIGAHVTDGDTGPEDERVA
jgi:DTW domain-containing protein YfiP